ncbi:hypothetical protein JMUB6875_23430 [Nocardia sp. JMUB6875]|uniref:hypothetical protein n=1 Tax=Nocardia sp. JMUB6875 TaxID=3158170 RepID=UPI0032E7625A
MSAKALVAWFIQIFDSETLNTVAARLGSELAERIVRGTATIADLFLASEVVGWELGELLPASLDELYGPVHDLDGRDVERIA